MQFFSIQVRSTGADNLYGMERAEDKRNSFICLLEGFLQGRMRYCS